MCTAAQVPQGATPRTMVVHLLGGLTRSVKPGDAVTLAGIFLPEPFTGFRAARAGLLTNTYLLAQSVSLDKRSYASLAVTDEQRSVIAVRLLGTSPLPPPIVMSGSIIAECDLSCIRLLSSGGGSVHVQGVKRRGQLL